MREIKMPNVGQDIVIIAAGLLALAAAIGCYLATQPGIEAWDRAAFLSGALAFSIVPIMALLSLLLGKKAEALSMPAVVSSLLVNLPLAAAILMLWRYSSSKSSYMLIGGIVLLPIGLLATCANGMFPPGSRP